MSISRSSDLPISRPAADPSRWAACHGADAVSRLVSETAVGAIGQDSTLLRAGLTRLLEDARHTVVALLGVTRANATIE